MRCSKVLVGAEWGPRASRSNQSEVCCRPGWRGGKREPQISIFTGKFKGTDVLKIIFDTSYLNLIASRIHQKFKPSSQQKKLTPLQPGQREWPKTLIIQALCEFFLSQINSSTRPSDAGHVLKPKHSGVKSHTWVPLSTAPYFTENFKIFLWANWQLILRVQIVPYTCAIRLKDFYNLFWLTRRYWQKVIIMHVY